MTIKLGRATVDQAGAKAQLGSKGWFIPKTPGSSTDEESLFFANMASLLTAIATKLPPAWIDAIEEFQRQTQRAGIYVQNVSEKDKEQEKSGSTTKKAVTMIKKGFYTEEGLLAFHKFLDVMKGFQPRMTSSDAENVDDVMNDFFIFMLGRRFTKRSVLDVISYLVLESREVGAITKDKDVTILTRDNPGDRDLNLQVRGSRGMIQWISTYFVPDYVKYLRINEGLAEFVYRRISVLPLWLQYLLAEFYYMDVVRIKRLPTTTALSWDPRTRTSIDNLLMRDAYYYSIAVPGHHLINYAIAQPVSEWRGRTWKEKTNNSASWMLNYGKFPSVMDIVMRGEAVYDLTPMARSLWSAIVASNATSPAFLNSIKEDLFIPFEKPKDVKDLIAALTVKVTF